MTNIRCYDNGGRSFDRYTVVYMDQPESNGLYAARGMSPSPCHPQGFGQYCAALPGRHLGKRIKFSELPAECQSLVKTDLSKAQS